jgi:hypothetical protein
VIFVSLVVGRGHPRPVGWFEQACLAEQRLAPCQPEWVRRPRPFFFPKCDVDHSGRCGKALTFT